MTKFSCESLSFSEKQELITLLEEQERRLKYSHLKSFYPDEGPLRRELYPKHLAFFRAGKTHRARAVISGNRTGKTEGCGGYELALHLTGEYPHWWEGRVFEHPIRAWAAGTTNITVRDILQRKLVGHKYDVGTGLIAKQYIIGEPVSKPGVPDAIETVRVRHISGGVSLLSFKSYESGRKAFEGTEQDVIFQDEEPPLDIHSECMIRTMTTDGNRYVYLYPS